MLLFAALVPVFYSDRYSLPLIPIYLTFAGLIVAPATGFLRTVPGRVRVLVLAAAAVWLCAWCGPYQHAVLELAPGMGDWIERADTLDVSLAAQGATGHPGHSADAIDQSAKK